MRPFRKLSLFLVVLCVSVSSITVRAQDDSLILADDPIAAMLDSLMSEKYYNKACLKPKYPTTNKFHFAPDSIPVYPDNFYSSRLAKLDAETPFDLRYNQEVRAFIELYTIKKRDQVKRMMGLTQLYFPLFEEMLDKYDMPLELKYLAIVESALNPTAKSRAGAMGMWQFMYSTGKIYNLKVTSYLDERMDVYKSTQAACEFLSALHGIFGDWSLALAAYNSGPGNVNKAIRRSGGKRTYWEIRPWLPRETQGYVPAFIAVNYVMNHTAEHNLYPCAARSTYFEIDTVEIKNAITFNQLSSVLNIPLDDIAYFNPCYRKDYIPSPKNGVPYILCLPKEKVATFISNEDKIYAYLKKDSVENEVIASNKEVTQVHVVRSGEHLNMIANRYKCRVSDLKKWNNLKSNYLYAGQKLTVHTTTTATAQTPAKPKAKSYVSGDYKYHQIQSGDTLWDLARSYGTSVSDLKKLNNFGTNYRLVPGMKIKVAPAG